MPAGGGAFPTAKVATTAVHACDVLSENVPAKEPITETVFDSFAPGEPVGFWWSSVNPAPLAIEAVELAGNPRPAKTNSVAAVVGAVEPLLTAVPAPCADAVWST